MAPHSRRTAPPVDRHLLSGVQLAFEDVAKGLVAKLARLVEEQMADPKRSGKAVGKAVAEQVPRLLEEEFVDRVLLPREGARRQRAMLVHVLSAVDVQPIVDATRHPSEDGEELTSEAASKLLHISRTHLNSLADSGALGSVRRTAGGHRRISKAALMAYKAQSRQRQAEGFDSMVAATEALGLYEDEVARLPVRSRR